MTRKHYWHVFLQRDVGTFKPRTIRRAIDRVAREWAEQDARINPDTRTDGKPDDDISF